MKRILLIGEAPAPDPGRVNLHLALALRCVGARPRTGISAWLRREHPALFEFVRLTRHVNLLPYWPGYDRRGSAFPGEEARERARDLRRRIVVGDQFPIVLLCGRRVAGAMGTHLHHADLEYFDEVGVGLPFSATYVVPHPSGVNRWFNEAANRLAARSFLEELTT